MKRFSILKTYLPPERFALGKKIGKFLMFHYLCNANGRVKALPSLYLRIIRYFNENN